MLAIRLRNKIPGISLQFIALFQFYILRSRLEVVDVPEMEYRKQMT